jgi:zinc protease
MSGRIRFTVLAALASASALPAHASQRPGDTLTSSYEVDGVRVIHRRVPSNDIIAVNLYLLGGSRQVTFGNAGIEPLLLAVSERGTAQLTREDLRRPLARTGSAIVIDVEADWTVFGLRTTTRGLGDVWPVFAARVVSPALTMSDVATVRDQFVASLVQRRDSPDEWAEHLADSVAFVGHPYGIDPEGTVRSVGSLTHEQLRAYHRGQFVKSRLLLVVVGNVERRELDQLVGSTLSRLPAGGYVWTLPDTLPRRPTTVHRDARALPTNYVIGYAPGPRADHPDYDALRVASGIVSGQLFAEVRSRLALSYAVAAPFRERAIGAVGLYVSTTDPVAALNAMRTEIRALQEVIVDQESLTPLLQQFITEYFLNNETNAAQADLLARSQLYQGDWRRSSALMQSLRAVTPTDIQRVMRGYFRNLNFAYVGDPRRLPDSAMQAWR